MAIPSYDDLTPSIPDVSPGEVFSSVGAVLPPRPPRSSAVADAMADRRSLGDARSEPGVLNTASPDPGGGGELYAALHDGVAAVPGLDRLMAIAREFSPRIERHRGGTVVLDVSGLQRLFGEAQSLADHLARAGAPQVGVARSR